MSHLIPILCRMGILFFYGTAMGGYGGIGRRAGFRFQWATVQVQVLLSAAVKKRFMTGHEALFLSLEGVGLNEQYRYCKGK